MHFHRLTFAAAALAALVSLSVPAAQAETGKQCETACRAERSRAMQNCLAQALAACRLQIPPSERGTRNAEFGCTSEQQFRHRSACEERVVGPASHQCYERCRGM